MNGNKAEAREFLESLHKRLNQELPVADAMREQIPKIVEKAKVDDEKKHMRQPETAFIHHYAFPILFQYMQSVNGIDERKAADSLLSECYRHMPRYSKNTPARPVTHPFCKVIGTSTDKVMQQWKGEMNGAKLKQSCPDFAFQPPFPYKVVFEGKYFSKGGIKKAETELVTDSYQAFFYRGLPFVAAKNGRPAWDYDYSCLFAYDATVDASLLTAWQSLDPDVRAGFWNGANLYVMILRGERTTTSSPDDYYSNFTNFRPN